MGKDWKNKKFQGQKKAYGNKKWFNAKINFTKDQELIIKENSHGVAIKRKILFNGESSLDWAVAKLKIMDKFIEGNCDRIVKFYEVFDTPEPMVATYTADEDARLFNLAETVNNEGLALVNDGVALLAPTYNADEVRRSKANLDVLKLSKRKK